MINKAKWIWYEETAKADSYGEFYDSFSYTGGPAALTISSDSNYAVYVNGELAAFGQYADFEHYKVADTVDIAASCKTGDNHLAIIVWHFQLPASTYCPQKAGLIYELCAGDEILAYSSLETKCRESRAYRIGQQKWITGQLGFSFEYDANKEDNWKMGVLDGFGAPVSVDKTYDLVARPNEKLVLEGRCASTLIDTVAEEECRYLFDLGDETVGFIDLEFSTEASQQITVAYGEHLIDGTMRVPQIIGGRDFSVVYQAVPGKNSYMNPFRRLAGRYLEVRCAQPIQIDYVGICPTSYPLKRTAFAPKDELDQRIYDNCVHTLECCLHEHYEDCPWREQSFYAMDSRNQMLCGYIAFNEFKAPRAGLALFGQDRHESGFLSICSPNASNAQLFIPSFSLHYFTAVDEYTQYSKDLTLAEEVYDKLTSLLASFAGQKKGDLLVCPTGKAWNFYEWRPQLDGSLGAAMKGQQRPDKVDIMLNTLYCLALMHMTSIANALGRDGSIYAKEADAIREAVRKNFYRPEAGLFSTFTDSEHYSETANALAILCGAAEGETAAKIAEIMTTQSDRLIPASLSMKCFPYDAVLAVDRVKYSKWVIDQIRYRYKIMLDADLTTTVWEDDEGAAAFGDAGSLCHGWSSIPIYYYKTLQDLI